MTNTQKFNAQQILSDMRDKQKQCRKAHYRKSKLKPYRAELVALKQAGASYAECVRWLRKEKRKKVHATTIFRFLETLPEMNKDTNNAKIS